MLDERFYKKGNILLNTNFVFLFMLKLFYSTGLFSLFRNHKVVLLVLL